MSGERSAHFAPKWFVLFVSSGSFFMTYFSRVTWSIISPYSSLHTTLAQDSFIFSLFFVGYVSVQIPAGLIADKVSPSKVTASALVGIAAGALLGGIAGQIWMEYLSSVLMGISAGWIFPATLRLIVSSFEGRELSKASGYYSTALPLALTVTGGVLPPLVLLVDWRWGLFIITILCTLLAIFSVLIMKDLASSSLRPVDSPVETQSRAYTGFFNRNVLMLGIAGFFFFFSWWYINLYAYAYFLHIHLDPYEAGVLYSLISVAGIFSSPLLGVISDKLGVKRTTIISIIAYSALMSVVPVASTIYLISTLSLVIGFLRFLINAAMTNIVAVVGGSKTGSTAGTANVFWQTSGIVGPLLAAGLIGYFGYAFSWLAVAVVTLGSALLLSFVKINVTS